jgi:RNA polymerase sigma-70 factor (ECF subfamily)
MIELSDEELMRSYQQGDFSAFETLYGRYSGKVFGFLRKRLGSGAFVDDIHQAIFLKLHEARSQYKKEFKFAPWLFVITRTTMIDHIRKQKRLAVETGTVDFDFQNLFHPTLEVAVDLSGLSESQRKVLELRFDEGKEFDAIAQELNTSSANIRQQVSRAIKKLRHIMDAK